MTGLQLIALVGLRGTGKTTTGTRLAKRLGWRFVDTDARLEEEVGCPVGEFLARDGEARFRAVEGPVVQSEVAGALAAGPGTVLALGGGAVLNQSVRNALLGPRIAVFWLAAAPSELARRIGEQPGTRPPLTDAGSVEEELSRLAAERESLYRAVAGDSIQTDGMDADAVCARILAKMPRG